MTARYVLGLDIVRYGLYALIFLSVAIGRSAISLDRLGLLAALLLTLVTIDRLPTVWIRSRPMKVAVLAAKLAALFALGLVMRRGWFPLLYFVVIAEAFFTLPVRQAAALWGIAFGVLGANLAVIEWPPHPDEFVVELLVWLTGFIFVGASSLLAVDQRTARMRSEQLLRELEATHAQLRTYAGDIERLSVARERQRLAHEVHDSVAHVLTGLLVQLQALRRLLQTDPPAAATRLLKMEEAARRGLDEVRRAVRAMRPEPIEGVGGVTAMRHLCDQFEERTGISVTFVTEGALDLVPAQEVFFYHALQECLTNAARHGRASTITATLQSANGQATLRVRDDGIGATQVTAGMGLGGMQERAVAAGGRFAYTTRPGEGFEVRLELPYPTPATAPTALGGV